MNVQLLSLDRPASTLDELRQKKISPNLYWFKNSIIIGDAHLDPAETLESFWGKLIGIAEAVRFLDRGSGIIRDEGLESFHVIGGDGDGHIYIYSTKSNRFFVWWHDPDELEPVANTFEEFIQWVITERADHLMGCNWHIYYSQELAHCDTIIFRVPHDLTMEDTINKFKSLDIWEREYLTDDGFALHSEKYAIDIVYETERRGIERYLEMSHNQNIDLPPKMDALRKSLNLIEFH